jgi:molybdate transport system substrate-binding protein
MRRWSLAKSTKVNVELYMLYIAKYGGVMLSRLAFSLFAALALLAGCTSKPVEKGPLVLAAASMQGALDAVAGAWANKGHPRPVISYAGSSALARQIESGAPADLFLSADEKWMGKVEQDGRIEAGTRADLLANALVLIAPAGSKAEVDFGKPASLAAALGAKGRLGMADPDAVPAGIYGKQALTSLGLWDGVKAKVASADNVRAALALVESGEAPLGVVYATDAKATDRVRVVATFPGSSHEPIRYPVAVIAGSTNPDARAFRTFLGSGEAQAIFARYGFGRAD